MEIPFKSPGNRTVALLVLTLWALLYLPHLRSNPNWYGDEGEWMDASWSLIHGHPRVDAVHNDFLYPYPYPPLYLLLNGSLLRLFGNDLLVGRAFGAVVALGVTFLLYWVGGRLRDKSFGWLCALSFLVYPEAVMNFRWARGHCLGGLLVLAAVGFLVRYVQEKRLRDIVLAGLLGALATATVYWTYPVVGIVILTAWFINRKHVPWAVVTSLAWVILFVAGYSLVQPGGIDQLMAQVKRLDAGSSPSFLKNQIRIIQNLFSFLFMTPARGLNHKPWIDFYPVCVGLGLMVFPIRRFHAWVVFWTVAMTYAVFKGRDNISIFMYPAMVFLPLMALSVAGLFARCADLIQRFLKPKSFVIPWMPAILMLVLWGGVSIYGSFNHFRTKIDLWTQYSVADAEAALDYINSHTTAADFVIVPKQVSWRVKHARKCMLTFSLNYEGQTTDMWPTLIERDRFWFDCRWRNAKYIVLASGVDAAGRKPRGIDLVFSRNSKSFEDAVAVMMREKWPIVHASTPHVEAVTLAPDQQWPVVVEGEYLIFANPQMINMGTK